MAKYRILEQFLRGQHMHEVHDLWEATPEEASWNLNHKRVELVVLMQGQVIIEEVADVPERRSRFS